MAASPNPPKIGCSMNATPRNSTAQGASSRQTSGAPPRKPRKRAIWEEVRATDRPGIAASGSSFAEVVRSHQSAARASMTALK